ncbi:MAG: alpha-hydroxy acid oxidase [Sphingobium sp.]|nr:alpha-hydroxy-acid oxidizing protein [Sphingobium sp.]MCP5397886.1 alpha-hydroxy-acid oxidizing protein [Sphingomonas sp.]
MRGSCYNIADLRRKARARAHPMAFDYIDGGADDEIAMRNNHWRFRRYEIAHKVLAGIGRADLSTTLLGHRLDVPFILSPSAGNRLFHKDGERAVAKAAARAGTIYSLSTLSTVSIEEIGALTSGPKWFQLYVWKDRDLVRDMILRAKAAGYTALILTVDLPVHGNRERELRNGFCIPPAITPKQIWQAICRPRWTWDYVTSPGIQYANLTHKTEKSSLFRLVSEQLNPAFSWDDAEWLLGEWNGPAVIKGVVNPADAARAVQTGFNAISISNHGGRQLDASPAPIDMLRPIRDHIGDAAELIVDGGVRRSSDIIKAMALGANAVSFARPYLYGLAAGGQEGVERALDLFVEGLHRDMILAGAASIGDLNESFIRARS